MNYQALRTEFSIFCQRYRQKLVLGTFLLKWTVRTLTTWILTCWLTGKLPQYLSPIQMVLDNEKVVRKRLHTQRKPVYVTSNWTLPYISATNFLYPNYLIRLDRVLRPENKFDILQHSYKSSSIQTYFVQLIRRWNETSNSFRTHSTVYELECPQ